MRFLQRLTQQLTQVWQGMSVSRRVAFVVLATLCLAAVGGVGYWAAQPDYRVLYSSLSMEDAGAVTAKLQAQSVPFKLTAGGTTILVPAEQVQQLRVDLAVEGLPSKGAKGFELLDGNALGLTPFMQHVNFGRALQAELAKTIMQLEPVAFARVHLVQPEPSPFIRDRKPTTASVVLKLKPGMSLTRNAAAGIVALVARSVEGLTAEQVTLLDTAGHVLYDQHGSDTAGAVPSSQLEYKREYEAYLASKAEDMLGQLLGQGHAIVRITADINYKSLTETKETFDAEQKIIKKESIQSHKTNSGTASRGGATGVIGNAARPTTGAPTATPPSDIQEDTDTEYYQPPKTVQQRVEGAGSVERLTVAAFIDRQAVPSLSLTEAQDIIKQAVGYKQGRDEIKVSDVKMESPVASTEGEAEWLETQRFQNYLSLARNASLGVAALVALVLGWLFLRRFRPAPVPATRTEAAPQETNATPETITAMAQRDPETVARLLRALMEGPDNPTRAAA